LDVLESTANNLNLLNKENQEEKAFQRPQNQLDPGSRVSWDLNGEFEF